MSFLPHFITHYRYPIGRMVSSQTINARDAKRSEQRRLIEEVEKEIGTKRDHPEDEEILLTRSSFLFHIMRRLLG